METGDGPKAREWINQRDTGTGFHPNVPVPHVPGAGDWGNVLYGFTTDNTKRPSAQRQAFTRACVAAVEELAKEDASLLCAGKYKIPMFPHELLPFTARHDFGKGGIKINFLVNYSWEWDLGYKDGTIGPGLKTAEVSRIDLIIRWGGRRRLSGFCRCSPCIRIFMWWMITGLTLRGTCGRCP